MGTQILVIIELVLFFGALLAFGISQQRMMRRSIEADKVKAD